MTHSRKIYDLCIVGLMTALLAVTSPFAIPFGGIALTLQSLMVSLAGILLGPKKGTLATLIYLFLGAIGLPIFSGFTGGLQCLVSPSGGFLLSFPLLALLTGLGVKYQKRFRGAFLLLFTCGILVNFACGLFVYCIVTSSTFMAGIMMVVLPFLPATIIKMILAAVLGLPLKKRIPV